MDETGMKPIELSFFRLRNEAYAELGEMIDVANPDKDFVEILEEIKEMQFVESGLELHQKFIALSFKVCKVPINRSYRDLALSILNSSLSIESQRLNIENNMAKTSSKH